MKFFPRKSRGIFITFIMIRPNSIIIIAPIFRMTEMFCTRKLPRAAAVAPTKTNTTVKPNAKKLELVSSFLLGLNSCILTVFCTVRNDRYAGSRGKKQGEKRERLE